MKHFLLISLYLFVLSEVQAQLVNTRTQVVYQVYASDPSGVLVSPSFSAKPNTATVKSGQTIVLNGNCDQGPCLWYGQGLPAEGAPFGTAVQLTNPGTESVTRAFTVDNSNNNAIIVTILPEQGVSEPLISANSYCATNPLLTATGCPGQVKWYTLSRNGFFPDYISTPISGAQNPTYQVEGSGTFCATCTVNGQESFGSEGILVAAGGVEPYIAIQTPFSNQSVCMWSQRTLRASGAGLENGTVTWYEKFGSDAFVSVGTGVNKSVTIRDRATQYYAMLSVPGCTDKISQTRTFAVNSPTTLASNASRTFVAHVQEFNTLVDDNCQLIASFAASTNNNEVNVMNGRGLTAKVTSDNSVMLYGNQPYLQRHYDFEPALPAVDPSYSIKMYFTQADFNAFNAASTVKLPTSSTDPEGYLNNLRIWQVHGTPTSLPATPANYTGGPPADYAWQAAISSNWNSTLNCWEVRFNTNGFSGFFVTAENAESLPVTLINFGAKQYENAIVLSWQTTEESNSDYFEIQHSTDGRQWNRIGQVASMGESMTLRHYTYTHTSPVPGENLYRMKMVDRATGSKDAMFAVSRIVSVDVNLVSVTSTVPIVSSRLLNSNGTVAVAGLSGNTRRLELKDLRLAPGLYVLEIKLGSGQTQHSKLIIE